MIKFVKKQRARAAIVGGGVGRRHTVEQRRRGEAARRKVVDFARGQLVQADERHVRLV